MRTKTNRGTASGGGGICNTRSVCLKHAWVLTSASNWVSLLRLSPFNKFCLNVSLASDQLESYAECNTSRTATQARAYTNTFPSCLQGPRLQILTTKKHHRNNWWNRPWKVLKPSHGCICEKHGLRKFSYCCQSSFSSTYVRKAVLGPNTKSIPSLSTTHAKWQFMKNCTECQHQSRANTLWANTPCYQQQAAERMAAHFWIPG